MNFFKAIGRIHFKGYGLGCLLDIIVLLLLSQLLLSNLLPYDAAITDRIADSIAWSTTDVTVTADRIATVATVADCIADRIAIVLLPINCIAPVALPHELPIVLLFVMIRNTY
jgi:hypothetical protein